jgi:hypothetical protein
LFFLDDRYAASLKLECDSTIETVMHKLSDQFNCFVHGGETIGLQAGAISATRHEPIKVAKGKVVGFFTSQEGISCVPTY